MRTDLVLDALRMALPRREPGADVELIHHSVRGSQYTSIDYTQTLTDHRVLASVGSVGDAYDNALAESFVDSFKTELIADRVWRSRSQLELAVVEYIGWYNAAREPRLHPAARVRAAARPTRTHYAHRSERVIQLTRSPSNPVRLSEIGRLFQAEHPNPNDAVEEPTQPALPPGVSAT